MVVIGGITRLTGSGLSITEWNLFMGTIPPLNDAQWNDAFEKYKKIPQFEKINYDYSLSDFKKIFFWEYLHRLIGRLMGMVFLIPFIYFYLTKQFYKALIRKSILLFALGGLQGFIGWFMVKSGLTERTSVSHYRLAIHLAAAFITFAFTWWFALQLMYQNEKRKPPLNGSPRFVVITLLVTILIQIVYGAFAAGLHAGKITNTFPTMNGEWVPSGIFAMSPGWMNIFENPLTVQFIHRTLAWIILLLAGWLFLYSKRNEMSNPQRKGILFLFLAVLIQFLLGVFTLLSKSEATLASFHQIGAFFLFSVVVFLLFHFRKNTVLTV